MSKASLDFETKSRASIKKVGMYRYAECPDFQPLMACYRVDDGPVQTWLTGQPCPDDLHAAIVSGFELCGWNVGFEAICLDWLHKHEQWPAYRPEQLSDTAAATAALGLPRKLGDAAAILGLEEQKDKEGERLIKLFCQPRRDGQFNNPADHPEDWQRFQEYCAQDVRTEEAIAKRVPPLSAYERRVWLFNLNTNRRGIRVDVNALLGAKKIAAAEKLRLDAEMREATNGAITSCSQVGAIKAWLDTVGVPLASLDKSAIAGALATPTLPVDARRVLELRQEAGKTSVAKVNSMLNRASPDGRVRGTAIYHGASTGRETSVGVNANNYTRPSRHWEEQAATIDKAALFRAIRSGDPAQLPAWPGGAMQLLSDALRSFIWAAPGNFIVQADYSNIEGVVAAWIAQEEWKLKAYNEIFADSSLPDLYRRTAARILGTTTDVITKKHPMRQSVGKVSELALGFGGGVAAFYSMAKMYGVDLDALYGPVMEAVSPELLTKAERRHARCVKRGEHKADVMSRQAWLACELIKLSWRQENGQIAAAWGKLEDAMREAVLNPGQRVDALRVSYRVAHGWLWCRLPSGRPLAYAQPRLRECSWVRQINPDGTLDDAEAMDTSEAYALAAQKRVRIEGPAKARVTVAGLVERKWKRSPLLGSLQFENVIQAIARDILFNGLVRLEDAGWSVVSSIYDEAIADMPAERADLDEFTRLLTTLNPEYAGLPISAAGFTAKRWMKG